MFINNLHQLFDQPICYYYWCTVLYGHLRFKQMAIMVGRVVTGDVQTYSTVVVVVVVLQAVVGSRVVLARPLAPEHALLSAVILL